ncbi:hypothetical protein HMPREF9398_0691 [Streptococcus sanguinis VMC66]|nr:hypothetical protein HMPREF9398_0691 [Streptococcus sanguinis VMC66]
MPLVHYYTLQAYLLNYPNAYLDGRDIHTVQSEDILARYLEIIMKVSTSL